MKDDVCEVLGLCPAGSKFVVAHLQTWLPPWVTEKIARCGSVP